LHPILGDLLHEEFWVLCLNNSNKVVYKHQLSKGGITGTVVDSRLLFKVALEQNATSIILAHNHPSGTLIPSDADNQITKKIKTVGDSLDIRVLDHLIITQNGYYSYADSGMI
jgi:DNA repair protein RadC